LERPPPPRGPIRFGPRFFLFAGLIVTVLAVIVVALPSGPGTGDIVRAIPTGIILLLFAARLATSRVLLSQMARQLGVFVALGAILLIGYSYRTELSDVLGRAMGTVMPSRGTEIAPGMMRFTANDQGQFSVDARVNGNGVRFLMDTGASGIVLSARDAGRLGFDLHSLHYTGLFSTANGMVRAAPVTLDTLTVGPFTATGVTAWVNEGDLGQSSLLGMSYLSTLGRIEIKGDTLLLER
jgi:aspartyl protease family protein